MLRFKQYSDLAQLRFNFSGGILSMYILIPVQAVGKTSYMGPSHYLGVGVGLANPS